jgi:hypothetical protein
MGTVAIEHGPNDELGASFIVCITTIKPINNIGNKLPFAPYTAHGRTRAARTSSGKDVVGRVITVTAN